MISPDLRFEGFDARSWHNLLSLFAPGVTGRARAAASPEGGAPQNDVHDPAGAQGTLLVVVDAEGHPQTALHTLHGRVPVQAPVPDPWTLCTTHGARRCVVLREGALEELSERWALRLSPRDDYLEQGLALLRTLRELMDAGRVQVWPRRYAQVPIPSPEMVTRALDLVLPAGRAAVWALWDGPHLWTAVAIARSERHVDWVVGPDAIVRWAELEGGSRRRAAGIVAGVARGLGMPVHVGVFAEATVVRRLLRKGDPGAWARAVAAGEVQIQPMPAYVAMALSADVLRAVAQTSASWLGEGVGAALTPVAERLRDRLGKARSLTSTLGFNPLELLSRFLRGR